MIRLLPKTIAVRIVLVLLLGLTVTHVASMAIYYGDRLTLRERLGSDQEAERIVILFRLVNRLGTAERAKFVDTAKGPNLRLSLSRQPPPAPERQDDNAAFLRDLIAKYLGKSGTNAIPNTVVVRYVSVSAAKPPVGGEAGMSRPLGGSASRSSGSQLARYQVIQASIRLDDGSWLNYLTVRNAQGFSFPMRLVLSTALMVLAVVVAGIWAARRVNAPLAAVARAAERLGEDAMMANLQEKGPLEVQRMARAFNQMQERIRNFVDDRTKMLAAISHDLRTPITRLRLRAEFIEDKEQHDKTLADLNHMETMISSVLSFVKDEHQREDREQIDLAALMLSICADISDAGHSAEFEDTETMAFMGRPVALKRAFTNLVENAVKYGGRARVRLTAESRRVIVRIEDDGPGIPEENMEKVFEPFFRIDRARNIETGGAGLGLALTRSIIRAHGGEIRLSNLEPKGLRVEVRLPF